VGAVVVENGVDDLPGWDGPLHGIEELDEFLMPVQFHAPAQHSAVQDVKGCEQRRCAVPLIVMGHGGAFAGLQGQAGLGPVQRLDLALFVNREHHGMTGLLHIKAHHILNFLREGRIVGLLEGAQAVRLQAMDLPDALHTAQTDAGGFGNSTSRPMGSIAGRLGAGQRQHLGFRFPRQGRLARLACLVAQKAVHAFLSVAPLPAPYRRTADAA